MFRFLRAAPLSLAAVAAFALAACGQETASSPAASKGVIELSDAFSGAFELVDKNEIPVSDADFRGKVMLVYFGFTHCPDVCPGDIGVMSAALNELGDNVGEVAPVFISVDPERDTPAVLRDYFAFDERIVALTGDEDASAAARASFKVIAQKQPLPDSALKYTIDHTRFYYVADRDGQPRYAIVGGVGPQELADLLQRSITSF